MRFDSTCRSARPRQAFAIAAVAAVLGVPAVQISAQTVFRASTDLVALQVTVVDAQRRYVPDLRQEDFAVLEDGHPQSIELFAAGTVPLDLLLLIDSSSSMTARMPTVRQAATNFVRALGPGDRAEVVAFSTRVRIEQELTNNRSDLIAAIQHLNAGGSTALYESVYVALKRLNRASDRKRALRRQAIVVLSDGDDTASHVSFADVHDDARNSRAALYAIVPPDTTGAADDFPITPESLFNLKLLAEETGGRAFTPQRTQELIDVYAEIADEFRQQYWLAYAPPVTAPGFHRIEVRIAANPALRARTRQGYIAGPRASGDQR